MYEQSNDNFLHRHASDESPQATDETATEQENAVPKLTNEGRAETQEKPGVMHGKVLLMGGNVFSLDFFTSCSGCGLKRERLLCANE